MSDMFRMQHHLIKNMEVWNTSSVTNMDICLIVHMHFNQDLTGWCVSAITSEPADFATIFSPNRSQQTSMG